MTTFCPICRNAIPEGASCCPSCGFTSPDRTQSFAPITLDSSEHTASPSLLNDASLKVVRGQQVGSEFRVTKKNTTIGRSPQCDIFLNDMTVSRDHASIALTDAGYVIEDHDSYNGVWINNENVKKSILRDGDIVQIGMFCLMFSLTPVS